MSRFKRETILREDSTGAIIAGATVTVYLAGTTDLATIYATKTAPTPITGSQVTTSSKGVYLYYADDTDYATTQLFKEVITKTGYDSVTYDDIDIIDIGVSSVTGTAPIASSGGSAPAISLNDAGVTYAKIQNISATDKVLGRVTAGAGVVEEITCTAAGRALLDDADAATQRTTLGVGTGDGPTFDHLHLTSGQIGFPATQVPSSDANTLDDYEEGTWTAAFECGTSGTITISPSYDTMSYTKIGRQVTVIGLVIVDSVSSPVGSLKLNGLPFTNGAGTEGSARSGFAVACDGLNATATTSMQGYILASSAFITIEHFAAGIAGAAAADIKAGTVIMIFATYFI